VPEGRQGQLGTELPVVLRVGKLEKRKALTVADVEKAMHVRAFLAEQLRFLAPRRSQREADNLFVECPHGFHVGGDMRVVVQPAGSFWFRVHLYPPSIAAYAIGTHENRFSRDQNCLIKLTPYRRGGALKRKCAPGAGPGENSLLY